MNYPVRGDMASFGTRGLFTIEVAGLMAAGILLVSTTMRMIQVGKQMRKKK